ncbi:MAG: hypothetical protein AB1330_01190 [Bacillota bacterium]
MAVLESNQSSEVSAYVVDTLAPAQPTGLASTVSQGQVALSWNPVVDNAPVVGEILQGVVDGVNKDFTANYTPVKAASYTVYLHHAVTGETLTADATYTVYTAAHSFKPGSVTVYVNGTAQTTGFTLDEAAGTVTFASPLLSTDVVTADYTWVDLKTETTDYTIDLATGVVSFVVAPVSGDTVVMDYTAELTDLAAYYVYRAAVSGGALTKIGEVASTVTAQVTDYNDGTAPDGSTVYYRISAVDDEATPNESVKSAELAVRTVPSVPTGLRATKGDRLVNLYWDDMKDNGANPNLSGYRVYRSTVSGGPYTLVATVTTNYYQDTGLTNGQTYYYVVTSVDENA